MNCHFCGTENPENATYCINCGKRMDGQIPCPACGTLNPEGAFFCMSCGNKLVATPLGAEIAATAAPATAPFAPATAPTAPATATATDLTSEKADTVLWKKIVMLAGGACAMLAVFFSLLFTFFLGLSLDGNALASVALSEMGVQRESFNLWYFLGEGYKDLHDSLNALSAYSGEFEVAQYLQLGFGTLISVATLVTVITFSAIAVLRFVNNVMGKGDKNPLVPALFAFFSFVCGAALFSALLGFTLSASVRSGSTSTYRLSFDMSYNRATVAGLVLGAIFLGLCILCHFAVNYRKYLSVKALVKTSLLAVSVVLVCVLLAILPKAAFSLSATEGYTTISHFRMSFSMLSEVFSPAEMSTGLSSDVWDAYENGFAYTISAQVVQFVAIIVIAVALVRVLTGFAGESSGSHLVLALCAVLFSVALLALNILCCDAFRTAMEVPDTVHDHIGNTIAILVLSVLVFALSIVQIKLNSFFKKQSPSENS